ncbi:MAG: class B sortase [Oscillospiraceae bacterium]|nr:class B sortase [Oscillospiraceae bacterium]
MPRYNDVNDIFTSDLEGDECVYDGINELLTLDGINKREYLTIISGAMSAEESRVANIRALPTTAKQKRKRKTSVIKILLPAKGDKKGEVIRKIIFLAATITFITAGAMLTKTLWQSRLMLRDQAVIDEFISSMELNEVTEYDEHGNIIVREPTVDEVAENNLRIMSYYHGINSDVVAFIQLPGLGIQQPVVQGYDNEYYLTRTYQRRNNKAGSIFLDYRVAIAEHNTSPNLVLYGHNQEDGTMFGNLKKYRGEYKADLEFYAQNPVIRLRTFNGIEDYLIYGFFDTNTLAKQDLSGDVFYYHDYIDNIKDEGVFNDYLNEIQHRNHIVSPVDVRFGDELILLSTCSNIFRDGRFVVFARKLRDGERVSDFDFTTAIINPNARGLHWSAITSAQTVRTAVQTTVPETSESEVSTTESRTVRTAPQEHSVTTTRRPPPATAAVTTAPPTEQQVQTAAPEPTARTATAETTTRSRTTTTGETTTRRRVTTTEETTASRRTTTTETTTTTGATTASTAESSAEQAAEAGGEATLESETDSE